MWQVLDRIGTRLFFRRPFFARGWGDSARLGAQFAPGLATPRWDDPATLQAVRSALRQDEAPRSLDIRWDAYRRGPGGSRVRRGTFATPYNHALLPDAARTAHVEWVEPADHHTGLPVCILFPATGEQGFLSRRLLAFALARAGIATLALEAPFYGLRRPPGQHGAVLGEVLDLVTLMDTTVREGRALLQCLHEAGYRRLAVSGISMGGSVSALVAARSEYPVAVIGMVPAHGVAPVYAQGLLAANVDWARLQAQLPGSDARALLEDYLSAFDVSNFPRPRAEHAACFISAAGDGCVLPDNAARLHASWPQARVEWIRGGHASGVVTGWNRYRQAIIRASNLPRSA